MPIPVPLRSMARVARKCRMQNGKNAIILHSNFYILHFRFKKKQGEKIE